MPSRGQWSETASTHLLNGEWIRILASASVRIHKRKCENSQVQVRGFTNINASTHEFNWAHAWHVHAFHLALACVSLACVRDAWCHDYTCVSHILICKLGARRHCTLAKTLLSVHTFSCVTMVYKSLYSHPILDLIREYSGMTTPSRLRSTDNWRWYHWIDLNQLM